MTSHQTLAFKISAQPTAALQAIARVLVLDPRDEAPIVLTEVLDCLMARLNEPAFVAFCGELEAAF